MNPPCPRCLSPAAVVAVPLAGSVADWYCSACDHGFTAGDASTVRA